MGWLEILESGSITADEALLVDFAHGAISGTKVKGGTVPSVKGKLELDGNNLFDGTPLSVTIWEVTLTADGEVDFMSDQPIELAMKGKMVTPAGKDAPFETVIGQIFS